MTTISDYEQLQCLLSDGLISLNLMRNRTDSTISLVKLPVDGAASAHVAEFLRHESAISLQFPLEHALQPVRFLRSDDGCISEFKNYAVIPLQLVTPASARSIDIFLTTAMSLTDLVMQLHDCGVLHRNLSPSSFLENAATGTMLLTGFYVAVTSAPADEASRVPLYYPPSVRYISPEQTGHIDRPPDERADLYSLGTIFYEMLCGEPPFTDDTTATLLYSHVAREPVPILVHNPNIPQPISAIVGKLLRKNPALRYKSARGVLADLEACRKLLRSGGTSAIFSPGAHDHAGRLQPLQNIYGRSGSLNEMHAAFLRAESGHAGCIFISGQAGVGKSFLVDQFRKSIDRPEVLFAGGKCEASSTSVPYHALSGAIIDLVRSIIAQGNESVMRWREILLDAIGDNREIIAEFIPEIQMLIGPCRQRTIPADAEAATQFKNVCIRFLRAFIRKESVLILFIDDLQWADSALSTILVPAFFEQTEGRFLLIGAGRTTFGPDDQLYSSITAARIPVTSINLQSLQPEHSAKLLAEALAMPVEKIGQLSSLVFAKTGGNPLFLKEFIEILVARRLLRFGRQPDEDAWVWDNGQISQLGCAENVVDIIIDKAGMLPPRTQRLLTIASCIGREFNAAIPAAIEQVPPKEVHEILHDALETGILQVNSGVQDNRAHRYDLRFSHDRIREAIYNRISPEERTRLHLLIGRTMLQKSKTGETAISVYDIVNHLNPYQAAISDAAERFELAILNREAARRSRNANACVIALDCLTTASALLPENTWDTHAQFAFEIELSMAECEFLLSRLDAALLRLQALGKHALNQQQHAAVDLIIMSIYDHRQDVERSMEIGFSRLKALDVKLPEHPSIPYLVFNLCRAAIDMSGIVRSGKMNPATNVTIPEKQQHIFRILSRMWLHAFNLQRQSMVMAIVAYLIRCTRSYGQCGAASVAICFWGILIAMLTRNPQRGLRYGTLALSIAKRFDDPFSRGITCFLYGSFFAHCDGHLDGLLDLYTEGRQCSYEAGDIVSTSNSTEGQLLFKALGGKDIPTVKKSVLESIRFLELIGIPRKALTVIDFIHSWADGVERNSRIDGNAAIAAAEKEVPLVKGIFLLFSLFTSTITGDHRTSLLIAARCRGNPLLDPTSYFFSFFTFLHAINLAADDDTPLRKRIAGLGRLLKTLEKCAARSPANIRHLHLLIRAEHHRLENRRWDALQDYRKSIETARRQRYIHHAAIAAERAAAFMKPYDIEESRSFMRTAMSFYFEWGAKGKVAQLRKDAPDVTFQPPHHNPLLSGITEIDFQALLKSFEAISTELLIDRLIEKLLRIVMENSGAVRGVLLLEEHGIFFARVEGVLKLADDSPESVIDSHSVHVPAEDFPVPQGILSYVQRTREPVRLENASQRDRFVNDPYINSRAMRSVVCVPLIGNDSVRGIIYLENNMLEAAFPPSRLQFIRLVCGQAIIAIENALFHDLEIKHLQSKVNPHFIFNALSSIAELCHSDPAATEDAIIKLSTLYRYVLTAEMRLVTLDEELAIVHKYLAIEKLRFGNRLSYEVRITGDPLRVRMPSMLIQPLVENSIKHGISPRPSGGTITIVIAITDTQCDVTVEDDGVGPNVSTAGTGYGLESIRKRLALQYKNEATFETDDAAGFKVHFSLPVKAESPAGINSSGKR